MKNFINSVFSIAHAIINKMYLKKVTLFFRVVSGKTTNLDNKNCVTVANGNGIHIASTGRDKGTNQPPTLIGASVSTK